MKKTTSEVDKLQKEWGNKPCNHDMGYGQEIADMSGCDYDCFCLQCGMRHSNPDFFIKRKNRNI